MKKGVRFIKEIIYHNIFIESGKHTAPKPVETSREVMWFETKKAIREHVESQRDKMGFRFKKVKDPKKNMGFQYISRTGGVIVNKYKGEKYDKFKEQEVKELSSSKILKGQGADYATD